MICVSIGRTRHKMVVAEHKHLAEQGAELVELRVDWLSRMPDVGRLIAGPAHPMCFDVPAKARSRTLAGR